MHKETIKAYSGLGKDRVFVGETTVDMPDSIEDAVKIEKGDKGAVVAGYIASRRIAVQRGIRGPKGGLTDEEKALLAEFRAKKAKKAPRKVINRGKASTKSVEVTTPTSATPEVKAS